MATELAKAYVQIVPSAQGIQGALSSALDGEATAAGNSAGSKLGAALLGGAQMGVAAFGAAATGMAAFGASSVEAGKAFDASMSQVAATMGVTVDEIGELRDFAQQMGSTTAFSATQAADALNYMALAGYDAETSMAMLPNVLNLAAAGGIDLAYASDMITDASSALGLSIEETSIMVDQMAMASSKSNTSVQQLGEAMLTIGATARNVSGGTEELATMLGVLADNGIKGSEGGTHLRNILLAMNPTTSKAIMAWENLGISAYDAYGNMRPLPEVMQDMSAAMEGMTDQEKQYVLTDIFNETDLAAVNALLNTEADRYEELAAAIEVAWYDEEGFQDSLATMGTTLDEMKSGMSDLGISASTFDEIMMQSGGDAELFADMLWEAADTGVTYEDILDGLGVSMEGLQKAFDSTVGSAQKMADTQLDNLAGDITSFEGALEGAKIAVSDQLTPSLREFVRFGSEGLSELTTAFQEGGLAGAMEALGGIVSDGLAMILEMLPEVVEAGGQLLTALVEGIAENGPLIANAAVEVAATITNTLLELLPTLLDAGLKILANIAIGIANAIPQLIDTIVNVMTKIVQVIIDNLPLLLDAALQIITALATGIFQALPTLLEQLPGLVRSLVETLLTQLPVIIEAGVELLTALIDDLPTIINTIVEVLPEIVDSIVSTLLDNLPALIEAGVTLFVALVENMPEITKQIVACIPVLIDNMLQEFANLIVKFEDMGWDLMMGLADGIAKSVESVIKSAVNSLGGVVDSIKAYFGIASPSKMFEEFGGYLDMGLAIGIENDADLPIDAMEDMSAELSRAYELDAEIQRTYSFEPVTEGGDITIPVYIGEEEIDTIVVNAQDRNQYRSGGR